MGLALRELSQPGDLVITIANDVGDPIPIYYAQRRGWVFPPANIPSHKGWNFMSEDPEVNKQLFEGLRAQGAKWLGIVSDPRDDTPGKEKIWQNHVQFLDYIHARCAMVQRTDEYVVYRIPEL